MPWAILKEINEMDYGLKEMNEVDYGLKKVRQNVTIEVNNIKREKLRLIDYVLM